MTDLINKIRAAQIDAGERAVIEHLEREKNPFESEDLKTPCLNSFQITVIGDVEKEIIQATSVWPPFNSSHEGYGILAEEFIELQQHVFTNQKRRDLVAMRKEAIQVAAMAIRFAAECCDESTGRK